MNLTIGLKINQIISIGFLIISYSLFISFLNRISCYLFLFLSLPLPISSYPFFIVVLLSQSQWLSYIHYFNNLSNAGINDWAKANENTNFGPVVNNLGVKPLKKAVIPSFLAMFFKIVKPPSGLSKFLF